MKISKTQDGSFLKIEIIGRIDTTTAPEFEAETAFDDGVSELELDFAGVEYISSAGLRVILKLQKRMNALGGKMKLTNVNDSVMDVFDITGFVDILTIE